MNGSLENIDREIQELNRKINSLRAQREKLNNQEQNKKQISYELEKFNKCREDSVKIAKELDTWIYENAYKERMELQPYKTINTNFAILFLGGVSGEWAARTRYRGSLPGFGGFLIIANGKHILIDPGRSTFDELISRGIHPTFLDTVIVTHSHWDATRDLKLILMGASSYSIYNNLSNLKKSFKEHPNGFHLYADRSVLYGIPTDRGKEDLLKYIKEFVFSESRSDTGKRRRFMRMLSKFHTLEPSSITAYDLFVRLRGRYSELEIGKKFNIDENIKLFTRKSYHTITFGEKFIPGLDFIIQDESSEKIRCVYLSDTEYHPDLVKPYEMANLGPINILILNVKTLDVLKTRQNRKKRSYTRRHLGWDGLIQITKDFKKAKLLTKESLVVLRAWGIETVTEFPKKTNMNNSDGPRPNDKVLVANTEKLGLYERIYRYKTKQKAIVPGISYVYKNKTNGKSQPRTQFIVNHIKPPYPESSKFLNFGRIYYCSDAMKEVIRQAIYFSDDLTLNVLIEGPTGSGKDELGKAIHQYAVDNSKRKGQITNINARQFTEDMFYTQLAGYKKGSHSMAKEDQKGFFATMNDGTIILQEIHMLPKKVQILFLTPLQERKYIPLGDNKEELLNVQLIFTTDQDLKREKEENGFSSQFLNRLSPPIKIPPLKERLEDIAAILYGWRIEDAYGLAKMPILNKEQLQILQKYDWPGNVRQLLLCVRKLLAQYEGKEWSDNMIRQVVEESHKESYTNPEPVKLDDFSKKILKILNSAEVPLSLQRISSQLETEASKSKINQAVKKLIASNNIVKVGNGPTTKYQ